jgi:hypothetical protein
MVRDGCDFPRPVWLTHPANNKKPLPLIDVNSRGYQPILWRFFTVERASSLL